MQEANLTVAEVARLVGCHIGTVKNYEAKGYIHSFRDVNNFRRFTQEEAHKLKEIFSIRTRESGSN